jgi:hypothetical protein
MPLSGWEAYIPTGGTVPVTESDRYQEPISSGNGSCSRTTYQGNGSAGVLVFHPADPTACSGAGVSVAPIDGWVGLGSQ